MAELSENSKSKTKLFFQTFSIRGISKIHHAKSRFEKTLWISFVIIMTFILILTMLLLVENYLQYITTWHTSTKYDDQAAFPGITFCAQNPFSKRSNDIWLKNQILTPTQMQDNLTLFSLYALEKPNLILLWFLRLYDLFSTFYMNLSFEESKKVGHTSEMIRYCIIMTVHDIDVAENCRNSITQLKIKLFSHQDFFNCYTVEGTQEYTKQIVGLIFILDIVTTDKIHELSKSFLIDMLNRGDGMKIVIHEPNTFPDFDNSGFNLHPSKMNSIVYSQTDWYRFNTPKIRCNDDQSTLYDLGRQFSYTHKHCLENEKQNEVIKKCKCMLSNLPRPFEPNSTFPYCLKLDSFNNSETLIDRFNCVEDIQGNWSVNREIIKNQFCSLRCKFSTYETTMSITQWKASEKKLEHLQNLYRSYYSLKQVQSKPNIENVKRILKSSLKETDSFRDKLKNKNRFNKFIDDYQNNDLTYVSITRKSFEINIKTEKLVLDSNTLLSRMGGLSSLCIGLTAAFVAEIIEFIYIICNCEKKTDSNLKNRRKRNCTNNKCSINSNITIEQ